MDPTVSKISVFPHRRIARNAKDSTTHTKLLDCPLAGLCVLKAHLVEEASYISCMHAKKKLFIQRSRSSRGSCLLKPPQNAGLGLMYASRSMVLTNSASTRTNSIYSTIATFVWKLFVETTRE
jgi:hypothetical protein